MNWSDKAYARFLLFVGGLGGFLYGIDVGTIAVAQPYLKDLDVYVDNVLMGKVLQVEEGIRSNNLRIYKNEDGKEYIVPFMPVFVENVDLENKRIDIVKMEGLL